MYEIYRSISKKFPVIQKFSLYGATSYRLMYLEDQTYLLLKTGMLEKPPIPIHLTNPPFRFLFIYYLSSVTMLHSRTWFTKGGGGERKNMVNRDYPLGSSEEKKSIK